MTQEIENVPEQNPLEAAADLKQEVDKPGGESTEVEKGAEPKEGEKKERTPEERELTRLRRAVDRKTRQLYELRARMTPQVESTPQRSDDTKPASQSDNEPLQLSRAELQKLVQQEAMKLAPTISQQQAEIERRNAVVTQLAKEWGQQKFDAYAQELDDAFGGLADSSGKPKPAADAIFEAENPRALIEYLADPENADEAEAIGRMGAIQAGRAIAKLEAKLEAKKAEAKPQPSKAAAPIEPVRGGGQIKGAPDPSDTKAWIRWRNEQEAKGRG